MTPFMVGIKPGIPWADFQETTKTGYQARFIFKIGDAWQFILSTVTISYQCADTSGNAQIPLKARIDFQSMNDIFTPKALPIRLFSSPNENFNLGTLNSDAQGMHLNSLVLNHVCSKGETIIIYVEGTPNVDEGGAPIPIALGCSIRGRKIKRLP